MAKVCHVTSVHPQEDVRIFGKECVSLAGAGYEVYLVQQGDSYEKNGVHLAGFGQMESSRIKRMLFTTRRAYQKAVEVDADVYHLHDPELLSIALKLKKKGKKVIFDSHERYTEQILCKQYLPKMLRTVISTIYGAFESMVLKRIDGVIFPCTMGGKNPFEGMCPRTAIISNAAILGEFFNLYDENDSKTPNTVCYVGSLTEERGITNDILAAAEAGAELILAGPFSTSEYEKQMRDLPAFSCVDYRGILDRPSVTRLLSETCVGLCTLLDRGQYFKVDNFSIKVYEYMSMGMPVIMFNSPYNVKMVEKYQFGICVDPHDVGQIANAIRYLLDHPEEARKMGENGRRAVKEEFNWGVEEQKLLALYEDILKN